MKNKEALTSKEKNKYKNLLSDLSKSIKNNEKLNHKKNQVDKKLEWLAWKIDTIKTQEQAHNLLDDVKKELQALKEYSEYNELSKKLEWKIEDFEKQVKSTTQQQLWKLQQNVITTNPELTKEQILSKADKWRKKATKEVSWIVARLAKKWGFLWKLAQLANKWKNL